MDRQLEQFLGRLHKVSVSFEKPEWFEGEMQLRRAIQSLTERGMIPDPLPIMPQKGLRPKGKLSQELAEKFNDAAGHSLDDNLPLYLAFPCIGDRNDHSPQNEFMRRLNSTEMTVVGTAIQRMRSAGIEDVSQVRRMPYDILYSLGIRFTTASFFKRALEQLEITLDEPSAIV